mgnify:CR=1 FL=1
MLKTGKAPCWCDIELFNFDPITRQYMTRTAHHDRNCAFNDQKWKQKRGVH